MHEKTKTFLVVAILTAAAAAPTIGQAQEAQSQPAQTQAAAPEAPEVEPLTASIQTGARHVRSVFTQAAEQMSEEDYAFRPTPEVRTLGEVLAHVADTNYMFCARATGEKAPVNGVEETAKTRAEIQKALADSFDYCEAAYASMGDEAKANVMVDFMGKPLPALAVLNFRNYHSLLHWGNVITYMRLRGKVPPAR